MSALVGAGNNMTRDQRYLANQKHVHTHADTASAEEKKSPRFQILHGRHYGYFYESMCRMRNKEYQQAEAELRGS